MIRVYRRCSWDFPFGFSIRAGISPKAVTSPKRTLGTVGNWSSWARLPSANGSDRPEAELHHIRTHAVKRSSAESVRLSIVKLTSKQS